MDRIDLLRIFVRVLETRSFSRAAADLDISRSVVSAAIQDLEMRFGARMFHRSTRSVRATHDGEALYVCARHLINDMEEVEALFRGKQSNVTGRVRIDAPARVSSTILAPALPTLIGAYPELHIELGGSDRLLDLVAEGVDISVRFGFLADSDLVARRVGDIRLVTVASPSYLKRYGIPTDMRQLAGHVEVGLISPSTGRPLDWGSLDGTNLISPPLRSRVSVNSADSLLACALAGVGIVRAPAYEVSGFINRGELVEILSDFSAPSIPVSLVWPHRRQMPYRVRVVSDWVGQLISEALGLARFTKSGSDLAIFTR